MSTDERRVVKVTLSGAELTWLALARAWMQALEPARAVTDSEVLRGCLREVAGKGGVRR